MENQLLSHRASERLSRLLGDLGYTLDPYGRVLELADTLGAPGQIASNLLSGRVAWSLDDIALVSNAFGKTPGFFLDPDGTSPLPTDTTLVRSEDGGENIVWRSPDGFLSRKVSKEAKLGYMSTTSTGFFSTAPVRTKLVFEHLSGEDFASTCFPDTGYILQTTSGRLLPMLCMAIEGRAALFSEPLSSTGGIMRVSDLDGDTKPGDLSIVGRAIGAIQGF